VAGNTENLQSLPLPLDVNTPSGVLWLNQAAQVSQSALVWLFFQGNDDTSGVAMLRLRDAGKSWVAIPGNTWSTLWLLPGPAGVEQVVEYQYKDQAGNLSSLFSTSIYLDINPALPASSHYLVVKSVFGATGSKISSPNYHLHGTLGQPSTLGGLSSASYRLSSGFWTPQMLPFKLKYLPIVFR
jgi:hypothetical protein